MPKDAPADSLRALSEKIAVFVKERDWEQFHSPKNISMAMAIEASELMEHFQWIDSTASRESMKNDDKKQAAAEELADVIMYALAFANSAGIDLHQAVEAKLKKNAEKYPVEKAKGNAKKYTEL